MADISAQEWDEAEMADEAYSEPQPAKPRTQGLARRLITGAAGLLRRGNGAASNAPIEQDFPAAEPVHFSLTARDGFLTVEGLEKSFGSRKVVEHVSIELMRGEAVGLLGFRRVNYCSLCN